MRERLLAAFVLLTVVTALMYAVPRVLVRADASREASQREVEVVARVAADRVAAAAVPVPGGLDLFSPEDRVVLRRDGVETVLAGPAEAPSAAGAVTAVRSLPTGGTVTVVRPGREVREAVVKEVRPILLTGLAALAVGILLAIALSLRLARPFRVLAVAAAELGREDRLDVLPAAQGVREADAIGAALRASSVRMTALLRREREFARNVSHQLRTPLTGLRLRVDDALGSGEVPAALQEDLQEVLREIDRLSDTITVLLSFARAEALGQVREVAPDDLLAGVTRRWAPLAEEAGRALVLEPSGLSPVGLPVAAVDQVLDVLVHNALGHGEGTVRLRVVLEGDEVVVSVTDEGALPDGLDVFTRRSERTGSGEGIGLALSAELAQVVGGRLILASRQPTTFALRLPCAG